MIGRVYCWRLRSYSLHPSIFPLYVNCGWRLGTSGKRECCCRCSLPKRMWESLTKKRLLSGLWEEELPLQCFPGPAPNADNIQVQRSFSYHFRSVIRVTSVWITSRVYLKGSSLEVFCNTIVDVIFIGFCSVCSLNRFILVQCSSESLTFIV